jgi:tetratricopeptide (TPR) repeat protein
MPPISVILPPFVVLCLSLLAPLVARGADWATDDALCASAEGAGAIEACTRMLTFGRLSYDGRAQVYLNRGLAFARAGDAASAIADLDESIRNWPNNPWAYNDRGLVYEVLLRQHGQAYRDYEMAVSIDPTNDSARQNLARMASLLKVSVVPMPGPSARAAPTSDPDTAVQEAMEQSRIQHSTIIFPMTGVPQP